jgi:hypothetical protein
MFTVNPSTPGLGKEVDRVLQENELVIRQWAPIHLNGVLKRWFWRNGEAEVSALDVWQKSCQYLYFPRLANSHVMQAAIAAGAIHRDFFALAYGKEDGAYRGFSLGKQTSPMLDASLLLIEPAAAADYEERTRPAPAPTEAATASASMSGTTPAAPAPTGSASSAAAAPQAKQPTHFFGSVEINPITASLEFSKVVSELVELFTAQAGTRVKIRVDIEAHDDRGFNEVTVRAARENAKVLGVSSPDFE